MADLQTALDQYKAEQVKARQTLIDNVADMIAAGQGLEATRQEEKEATTTETGTETSGRPKPIRRPRRARPAAGHALESLRRRRPQARTRRHATDNAAPPPKPQKGYYHVVASGETLTLICEAYRENGVNVTVSQIRKANGLTNNSVLKPGQKLFIPKPEPNL